ncbi:medial cortical node Gef2-related protein Nod1 [Schizosaccharomyces osmophilus]|uniref:Medial cortical node Gef2-related protein Nod1 n=1 Tax=Schizosaccharomyces osmophilus TaxID=2545709 RepID=A0AAE9WDY4_9SCHI|nr:medial cortical node Gef2-related protein Nod1 [Schizosaccharomyces osmophilus]WBW74445.1 medial cortical node Gef2-related protein Nod1 [Schizosaccharomyces osmophilus]
MEKPLPKPPSSPKFASTSNDGDFLLDDLVFGLKRYEAAFYIKSGVESVLHSFTKAEELEMIKLSFLIADSPYRPISLESVPSKILFGSFLFYVKDKIYEKAGHILDRQFCFALRRLASDDSSVNNEFFFQQVKSNFLSLPKVKIKMLSVFFSIVQIVLSKLRGGNHERVQFFASIAAVILPKEQVDEMYFLVEYVSINAQKIFQIQPPSPRVLHPLPQPNNNQRPVLIDKGIQKKNVNLTTDQEKGSTAHNNHINSVTQRTKQAGSEFSWHTENPNIPRNTTFNADFSASKKERAAPGVVSPAMEQYDYEQQTKDYNDEIASKSKPTILMVPIDVYEKLNKKFIEASDELRNASNSYQEIREEIDTLYETFADEVNSFENSKKLQEEKIFQEKISVERKIKAYQKEHLAATEHGLT